MERLNSFQKWAMRYAYPYGITVAPKGNWVTLFRRGDCGFEFDCMTESSVRASCQQDRDRRIVADYVAEGLGEF